MTTQLLLFAVGMIIGAIICAKIILIVIRPPKNRPPQPGENYPPYPED